MKMLLTAVYDGRFLGTHLEGLFLAYSVLTGAVLGAFYDLFRAFRISVRHHPVAVAAEDVLFSMAFGLVYFSFCVHFIEGSLRAFVLAGMIVGFFLYIISLGRIVSAILSRAMKTFVVIVKKLVRIIKKTGSYLCTLPFFRKVENKP